MRKLKVYLETTMFNYYFDVERDAHPDTVKMFEEIKAGKYEPYTSTYAIKELMQTKGPKRDKMLELLTQHNIKILDDSQEAERLAELYIKEGVIPPAETVDALHVAVASINDLDMIVSLNFSHIVRKKTIELAELVNVREGYRKVLIYAPMEVVDREND